MERVRFSSDAALFDRAARLYAEVEPRLRALLPAADIQHVGSTAVPGSVTKGDLDVVVRVEPAAFAAADKLLGKHFDRNLGSDHNAEFAAFSVADTQPELGIQLVAIGGGADHFLAWRDRLVADPELRAAYDGLKTRFDGASMDAYRAAKGEFIRGILSKGKP